MMQKLKYEPVINRLFWRTVAKIRILSMQFDWKLACILFNPARWRSISKMDSLKQKKTFFPQIIAIQLTACISNYPMIWLGLQSKNRSVLCLHSLRKRKYIILNSVISSVCSGASWNNTFKSMRKWIFI